MSCVSTHTVGIFVCVLLWFMATIDDARRSAATERCMRPRGAPAGRTYARTTYEQVWFVRPSGLLYERATYVQTVLRIRLEMRHFQILLQRPTVAGRRFQSCILFVHDPTNCDDSTMKITARTLIFCAVWTARCATSTEDDPCNEHRTCEILNLDHRRSFPRSFWHSTTSSL